MDESVQLKGVGTRFRAGTCIQALWRLRRLFPVPPGVKFSDESSERVCHKEVVAGALVEVAKKKHSWPGSMADSTTETVSHRTQKKESKSTTNEVSTDQAMLAAVELEQSFGDGVQDPCRAMGQFFPGI